MQVFFYQKPLFRVTTKEAEKSCALSLNTNEAVCRKNGAHRKGLCFQRSPVMQLPYAAAGQRLFVLWRHS